MFVFHKKKPTSFVGFLIFRYVRLLGQPDILRPWAFGTLPGVVGHSLPFLKFLVGHSFNVRHVKEHVIVSSSFNETKTFVRQPLDRAFCHLQSNF